MVAIHSMLASLRDSMSVCGTLFVPVAPPLVLRPADTAFFVALPVGTPEYQPYLRHHCCLGKKKNTGDGIACRHQQRKA